MFFKKSVLSCLFLALLCCEAQAQQRDFECNSPVTEKDALNIMDRVQKKYSSVNVLYATFRQSSYLAAVDAAEDSSGKVWLAKPSKMKWHYEVPEEQVFLMNGDTLWYYQPLDQQVMIQDFEEVVLTDVPVAFLMGMGDLRKDFKLQSACRSANGVVLKLKPNKVNSSKEAGDELEGFSLLIDTTIDFPHGAQIVHVGGNKTSIILEDMNFQAKISDDIFSAKFPEGTDVNDLRGKK